MDGSRFYFALVDKQLFERNEFDPIEFLLDAGLVDELTLRAWRQGEGELAATLLCDEPEVTDALREAQQYCTRQGLLSEQHAPAAWSDAPKILAVGGSRAFGVLCSQRFLRSGVGRQRDLFQDSAAIVAIQDTARALVEGKFTAAKESLARMKQLRCETADVDAMNLLLQSVKWLPNDEAADKRLDEMEQRIVPTARRYLQERANEFLAPLWVVLATCLPMRFAADKPLLYASYALFKSGRWQQVVDSVHGIERWQKHDVLVVRLVQSLAALKEHSDLRRTWSLLCWVHPDAAAYHLSRFTCDLALCNLWQEFCDSDAADCDASDFPAWLLLADSKQSRYVSSADTDAAKPFCSTDRSVKRYAAVYELVSKDCIANRATLNELCPWLLAEFLRRAA